MSAVGNKLPSHLEDQKTSLTALIQHMTQMTIPYAETQYQPLATMRTSDLLREHYDWLKQYSHSLYTNWVENNVSEPLYSRSRRYLDVCEEINRRIVPTEPTKY